MYTQEQIEVATFTATFQILMERAIKSGLSAEDFTNSLLTEEGKKGFEKVAKEVKQYYSSKWGVVFY